MNLAKTDWSRVRHFTPDEWKQDSDRVAPELVYLLDDVRERAGVPIVIHEAWAEDGHSDKSWHYKGEAVDFHLKGLTPFQQFEILNEFNEIGAIGWYPGWNHPGWHVDIRPMLTGTRLYWWRDEHGAYHYTRVYKEMMNTILEAA